MKNMKRIHKVTIKRMIDESPDTSWLGEYGQRSESEYAIDRKHATDCPAQPYNYPEAILGTIGNAMDHLTAHTYGHLTESEIQAATDAQDLLIQAQDELQECNCGGQHLDRNSYEFFNPNHENYKGSPEDEIRKYCLQDYERMESLNAGDFCFIGIRAEAEYSVGGTPAPIQELSSGGLWGIESDSSPEYIKETEDEQLSELKSQLKAIGFSSRAIATAFKTIERGFEAR